MLLQDLGDEDRSDKPKTWPTPWQRNIDFGNSAEQTTALWKTPLRRDGKIFKTKNKDQGTATSAADPADSLMKKRMKSDNNSEPWHTPSRWGVQDLENEIQEDMIPMSEPTDLTMDQSHSIHSTPMSVDKISLSLEHYPRLKNLHANSNMESWSRPRRRKKLR